MAIVQTGIKIGLIMWCLSERGYSKEQKILMHFINIYIIRLSDIAVWIFTFKLPKVVWDKNL